jgi:hypothetical protein
MAIMKTTKQIAADCGLDSSMTKLLDRVLTGTISATHPIEGSLHDVIGALYRRIELLETRPTIVAPEIIMALAEAKAALVGDSNDAEHDALFTLVTVLGVGDVPECDCDKRSWYGEGHDSACPCAAWQEKS